MGSVRGVTGQREVEKNESREGKQPVQRPCGWIKRGPFEEMKGWGLEGWQAREHPVGPTVSHRGLPDHSTPHHSLINWLPSCIKQKLKVKFTENSF